MPAHGDVKRYSRFGLWSESRIPTARPPRILAPPALLGSAQLRPNDGLPDSLLSIIYKQKHMQCRDPTLELACTLQFVQVLTPSATTAHRPEYTIHHVIHPPALLPRRSDSTSHRRNARHRPSNGRSTRRSRRRHSPSPSASLPTHLFRSHAESH